MANSRMLAKSISISSQVSGLSLFAQLLFTWMIAHADDWGVLVGEARRVRALVIPMNDEATDAQVEEALRAMEAQELIWRYQDARGVPLIQFRTWETHQQGLHKRTAPKLPRYGDMLNLCANADRAARADRAAISGTISGGKTPEIPGISADFPELPGTSRNFPANRTEQNRTEQKGRTPTVDAALAAGETPQPPTAVSAPEARSLGAASAPADGMESPEPRPQPTAMPTSAPPSTPPSTPLSTPLSTPAPVVMFALPERLASDTTERTYWERVMKELPSARRVPLLVHLAHEKIGVDDTSGGEAYARLGQLARKHTASLVAVWIIQASGQDIAGHPLDYLTRLANGQLERQRRPSSLSTAARSAGQRNGQRSGQRDNRGVSRDDYFAEVDAESRRLNDEFRRTGVMPGLSPPGKIGAAG